MNPSVPNHYGLKIVLSSSSLERAPSFKLDFNFTPSALINLTTPTPPTKPTQYQPNPSPLISQKKNTSKP
jgi:hypothetical protein